MKYIEFIVKYDEFAVKNDEFKKTEFLLPWDLNSDTNSFNKVVKLYIFAVNILLVNIHYQILFHIYKFKNKVNRSFLCKIQIFKKTFIDLKILNSKSNGLFSSLLIIVFIVIPKMPNWWTFFSIKI